MCRLALILTSRLQLVFLAWVHHQFILGLSTRVPTSFYAKCFSSQSVPQPIMAHGVTPAQSARFSILPLLTLTKVSLLFQPAEVPLNGHQHFSISTTAPALVSSQFCRRSSVQSSRLFMKPLKSISSSISS